VSVKCDPGLAVRLRAAYTAMAPGYHLNKRHWNTITLDGSVAGEMVGDLLGDSYELVVRSLPKVRRPAGRPGFARPGALTLGLAVCRLRSVAVSPRLPRTASLVLAAPIASCCPGLPRRPRLVFLRWCWHERRTGSMEHRAGYRRLDGTLSRRGLGLMRDARAIWGLMGLREPSLI